MTVKTLRNLVFLPGRLVIRWIDGRKAVNGVGPLDMFQRGAVHAFLGSAHSRPDGGL
jgi:hypothetical protein